MSETIIRINDSDGLISVERTVDGVKSFKQIDPNSLLDCINRSLLRGGTASGLLPKDCLSFAAFDNGCRDICLFHQSDRADVTYFGTEYKGFPLPRLVFGFRISKEKRVSSCRLGVITEKEKIKPNTPMFHYPLSNVSGFSICTGNNSLPRCDSPHTLSSLPYHIMAMPNNNDHFNPANNKQGLEMRNLLELLKDKEPSFYYSDILLPSGKTLNDFLKGD